MRLNKKWKILAAYLVFLFGGIVLSGGENLAFADSVDQKWLYTQYYQCLKPNINGSVAEINYDKSSSNRVVESVFTGTSMSLPSFRKMGADSITCKDLVTRGIGSNASPLSAYTNLRWRDNGVTDFMINTLFYESEDTGSSNFDLVLNARVRQVTTSCYGDCPADSDQDAHAAHINVSPSGNTGYLFYKIEGNNLISDLKLKLSDMSNYGANPQVLTITASKPGIGNCKLAQNSTESLTFSLPTTAANLQSGLNEFNNSIGNQGFVYSCSVMYGDGGPGTTYHDYNVVYYFDMKNNGGISTSNTQKFVRTDTSARKSVMQVAGLGTGTSLKGIKFTNEDYYNLYYHYIKAMTAGSGLPNALTCNPSGSTDGLTPVKLYDGEFKDCYANFGTANLDTTIVKTQQYANDVAGGVTIGISDVWIIDVTMQAVINWMNQYATSSYLNPSLLTKMDESNILNQDPGDNPANPSSSSNPDGGSTVSACLDAGGPLGWIICPVVGLAGNAASGLYEEMITPFLEIKSGDYSTGSKTYDGWNTMRSYANILFAIAFVIVILAQITGIGISNYNIKKLLPRLIAIVVLVNISFLVCQLLIDVSNVLGSAVYALFVGLADQQGNKFTFVNGAESILGGLGFMAGAGLIITHTWELWLPFVMLAILGALVSILFFFILLGVRRAGVIILTVLSPLAIVCYALPNTKSLFDKWKKAMTGLLTVYPICGALMGGGQFAATLIIGDDNNILMQLIGMLMTVIPFFFIPTILRNSLNAIGGLGTRISNFGNRMSRFAQGTARNSEAFREHQRQYLGHRDTRIARGLQRRRDSGRKLSERQTRRLAIHKGRSDRMYRENEEMEAEAQTGLLADSALKREAILQNTINRNRDSEEKATQALYRTGTVNGINGGGRKVSASSVYDTGNEIGLATEQKNLMLELDRTDLSADQRRDLQSRLDAVTGLMAETDDGRTAMVENFKAIMQKGTGVEGGKYAAQRLIMTGEMEAHRKDAPAFKQAIQDLANGKNNEWKNYDKANQSLQDEDRIDAYYASAGANKLTEADFANADDGMHDSVLRAMRNGALTEGDAALFTDKANRALSDPRIHLKPQVREKFEEMVSLGYGYRARQHSPTSNVLGSEGAKIGKSANAKTLDAMASRARRLGAQGITVGDENYQELQRIGEVARQVLEGPDILQPDVEEGWQKVYSEVRGAKTGTGADILDLNGAAFQDVETRGLKIDRRTATPTQHVEYYQTQYTRGNQAIAASNGGTAAIDINVPAQVRAEHGALVQQLRTATTAQERNDAFYQLSALQNLMMTKTPGGQELLQQVYEGYQTDYNNMVAAGDTAGAETLQMAMDLGADQVVDNPVFKSANSFGAPTSGQHYGFSFDARSIVNATPEKLAQLSQSQIQRIRNSEAHYSDADKQGIAGAIRHALAHQAGNLSHAKNTELTNLANLLDPPSPPPPNP